MFSCKNKIAPGKTYREQHVTVCPAYILMFHRVEYPFLNTDFVKIQMYQLVRVAVQDITDALFDGNVHQKFLHHLSAECFAVGFTFFYLSAGKLPFASQMRRIRPLSYKISAVNIDDGGNNIQFFNARTSKKSRQKFILPALIYFLSKYLYARQFAELYIFQRSAPSG